MSDSQSNPAGPLNVTSTQPRAVIHKQILDVAEERPDATIEELASQISGASGDLVERVLGEYGDPTDESSESEAQPSTPPTGSGEDASESLDHSDITLKQRQTLEEIYKHPGATQSDIAEIFDIGRTSINHRLNNIPGFEWERRHEFVQEFFEERDKLESESSTPMETDTETGPVRSRSLNLVSEEANSNGSAIVDDYNDQSVDLALVHKALRECIKSDEIDEEEEFALLRHFMSTGPGTW